MEIREYRRRLEGFFETSAGRIAATTRGAPTSPRPGPSSSEHSDLFSVDAIREIDREIKATAAFLSRNAGD